MEASWPAPKVREPSPLKAPSTFKTTRPSDSRSTSLKSQLKDWETPKTKEASRMGASTKAPKPKELEATELVSSSSQVRVPEPLVVRTKLSDPSAEGQV